MKAKKNDFKLIETILPTKRLKGRGEKNVNLKNKTKTNNCLKSPVTKVCKCKERIKISK